MVGVGGSRSRPPRSSYMFSCKIFIRLLSNYWVLISFFSLSVIFLFGVVFDPGGLGIGSDFVVCFCIAIYIELFDDNPSKYFVN